MHRQQPDRDNVEGSKTMQQAITRREAIAVGAAAGVAAAAGAHAGFAYAAETADSTTGETPREQADVVVLGAGAAGLAAAATAAQAGASVVVLEAGSFAGGATIYSGGHMLWLSDEFNAAQERNDDELQGYLDLDPATLGDAADDAVALHDQVAEYLADTQRTGRFDSVERVLVDHYLKGAGTDVDGNPVHLDYARLRHAAETSMDVLTWLQSGGMEIKDSLYSKHANSPVKGGSSLVEALLALAEQGGADVRYESRARGILMQDGAACGVRYEGSDGAEHVIDAGRVVVATGGYAANPALAALYQNVGEGLTSACGTTNPPTNRGEGMALAQRCGAEARDLQFLVTVLEGYHGGSTLAEAGKIVAAQQLVVNAQAQRFMDENPQGSLKSTMNNPSLNAQPDGLAFFVGDASMLAALNEAQDGLADDLSERDWFCVADTLAEAAEQAGLSADALEQTVDAFNSYVDGGADPDFGRTEFAGTVKEPPFVVAKMEVHYHLTLGGLVVDEAARVIGLDGQPVAGLYAAGDVTSGYEGLTHQSGMCLSVVVSGGITAGTLE